ncbi:hypothetical protein SEA_NICEHOUSE_277 [Rhodococcus phage NiceHouse]|nr:hypothetical protein SEA_NICEHOUSE_277 [Rhodococcus phage NiceHouse]
MTGYSIGGVELPGDIFALLSLGPGPNDTIEDYDRAEAEYKRLRAIYEANASYELVVDTYTVQITPAPITGEPKYSEVQRIIDIYDHNYLKIDSKTAKNPEHETELISELQAKYKIPADKVYIRHCGWSIATGWVIPRRQ